MAVDRKAWEDVPTLLGLPVNLPPSWEAMTWSGLLPHQACQRLTYPLCRQAGMGEGSPG